jgi:hypothetical protein
MTALIIAFVVLVVISIVLIVLKVQTKKWARIPLFVSNSVGGNLAFCSIADYEAALKDGTRVGGKVMVPETVVLLNPAKCNNDSEDRLFRSTMYRVSLFNPQIRKAGLFVPFTSEGMLSSEQQKIFFSKPSDLEAFVEQKRHALCSNDWRLRLVEWEQGKLTAFTGLMISLSIVYGLALLLTYMTDRQKIAFEEQGTVYTSDENGAVRKAKMKMIAPTTLLLPSGDSGQIEPLIRGKIIRVEPLSAELSYACIERLRDDSCGFTSRTIHFGDEGYLRTGIVQTRIFNDRPLGLSLRKTESANWFITQPEADALVKTGKFRIVDAF